MSSPTDLRDWIALLEREGELVRVAAEVDPCLEISEIVDRVVKTGGPALLFEHVLLEDGTRSPSPVAINLFGSMRRMCLALGVDDLDRIGGRISELLNLKVPEGLFGKLAMLPSSRRWESSRPR